MNSLPAPPEWDLLLSAAQKNQPDKIRYMVSNGVDPNHANAVGQSALHIASLWGHVESAAALLEAGANPNAKNRLMGSTPLHMVAQSHKASPESALLMVALLVEHGADIGLPDDHGSLPVAYASDQPSKKLLMEKLQPQKPPIFNAIGSSSVEQAREALEKDPSSVNLRFMGLTPVGSAVEKLLELSEDADDPKVFVALAVLNLLVESGGQLSSEGSTQSLDVSDTPPLLKTLEALRLSYKSCPDSGTSHALGEASLLLLRAGVPLTSESRDFLHQAARRNELKMTKFLIERLQVDPNTPGRQGMTPLQFAARSGQMEVLRYLLSLDTIDIRATDDRGQTALDAAKVNHKQNAIEALEEHLRVS